MGRVEFGSERWSRAEAGACEHMAFEETARGVNLSDKTESSTPAATPTGVSSGAITPAVSASAGAGTGGSELLRLIVDRVGGKRILLAVAMLALALAVFSPALGGGEMWDDAILVLHNSAMKSTSGLATIWYPIGHEISIASKTPTYLYGGGIGRPSVIVGLMWPLRQVTLCGPNHSGKPPGTMTVTPFGITPDYFPVMSTLFWVEWRVWGHHLWGYRLVSIFLHTLGAVLLWRILVQLGIPAPWLGAVLYLIHPVTVESVVWIAELKNTLSGFFCYLALTLFLEFDKRRQWGWYVAALLAFLLALLSKTTVVTLAPVLVLCIWWRRSRVAWRDIAAVAPFFLLALILGLVTMWFQYRQALHGRVPVRPIPERVAGAGWVFWFYVLKDVFPYRMLMVYPYWHLPWQQWWAWLPDAAMAMVAGSCWWFWRVWGRAVAFGLGFFLISVLPVMGLVSMAYMGQSLVADHLQYVAIPGITALFAGGLAALLARRGATAMKIGRIAAVVAVAVLAVRAAAQSAIYANPEHVWKHTLRYNPASWAAHMNLGSEYFNRGHLQQAESQYLAGLRIQKHSAGLFYNYALLLKDQGHVHQAIAALVQALKINRTADSDIYLLAALRERLGQWDRAYWDVRKGLDMMPQSDKLHQALARIYWHQAYHAAAIAELKYAIALNPTHSVYQFELAQYLDALKQYDRALPYYRHVVHAKPGSAMRRFLYGRCLLKNGEVAAAVAELESGLKLHRHNAEAHLLLAQALQQEGHPQEALRQMALYHEDLRLLKPLPKDAYQLEGLPKADVRLEGWQ